MLWVKCSSFAVLSVSTYVTTPKQDVLSDTKTERERETEFQKWQHKPVEINKQPLTNLSRLTQQNIVPHIRGYIAHEVGKPISHLSGMTCRVLRIFSVSFFMQRIKLMGVIFFFIKLAPKIVQVYCLLGLIAWTSVKMSILNKIFLLQNSSDLYTCTFYYDDDRFSLKSLTDIAAGVRA